jgi:hypothetical protein
VVAVAVVSASAGRYGTANANEVGPLNS